MRFLVYDILVCVLSVCGCVSNAQNPNSAITTAQTQLATDSLSRYELPLPDVPDSLRTPYDRAAYITEHFWDAMDFRDTLRSRNTDFMEQNFSNFISVLPFADKSARRMAVGTLMLKAEADSTAYVLLADIAESYLYNPISPMLSEDIYMLFIEQLVSSPILGKYGTLRYRYQLDAILKNRPGTIAANFTYTTREGSITTLHKTHTDGYLLLIFYNPDCEHCEDLLALLQSDERLNRMIADKRMTVLAVHSGDAYARWEETAGWLPEDWSVGYESGLMQENGSYVLRAMPTLYLFDRNKRVVLKDAQPERLMEWLSDCQ